MLTFAIAIRQSILDHYHSEVETIKKKQEVAKYVDSNHLSDKCDRELECLEKAYDTIKAEADAMINNIIQRGKKSA